MPRNEYQTCREIIEPALIDAGWGFDRDVEIGPGRVNLSGEQMYDSTRRIVADYVLRLSQMPLAILEAKAEDKPAADGMQQGSCYAQRLGLRFSIASNGSDYILTDNQTGNWERLTAVPTPRDILTRLGRANTDWEAWRPVFEYPWYEDQITRRRVRPYQEMAVAEALYRFSQGIPRALLLMATGTGKTFTIFQLVWKLLHGNVLRNNRILFLTDRNSLKDQAYRAFAGFSADDRVVIDKNTVRLNQHQVGRLFFANYQNLDEELNGKKIYQHFEPDFFDLVVVDECHRSGFGDWFGVLEYFGSAFQLGLTATPREIDDSRPLTEAEQRRDTYEYFGEPAYTYSLKQAIEDGYLNPLEQRDLTQELWTVRDAYRSAGKVGMNVVIHATVLLFLRWADFYESEQEAIAAFDQVDYTPSLPNHLRWAALERLSKFALEKLWRNDLPSSFKAAINTPLGYLLQQFAYVIEFNPPRLAEPLFQFFHWVGSLPFETAEDRSACGRALESLISQTASGKDGGEFITPQPIVDLMIALANPQLGERIYDPCFGMGGLLVASARQLIKNVHLLPPQAWLNLRDNSIFGIEINSEAYVIGLTRLILEGIDRPRLELGDTLERPLPQIFTGSVQENITQEKVFARPGRSQARKGNSETLQSDEGFDCILASPPWGGKQTSSQYANHFPIPVGSTEGLFLEHVMYSLRPGGRAVIALPDGVLFRQGHESKLRERLLTDFSVEGVIALPPGAFTPYTGVKASLLVLHRKPPAPSVRFFRVEDFPTTRGELANYTQIELELKAKELVSQFRSGETTENLWNTPIESLAKRSWELVVKRFGDNVLLERLKELQAADPGLEIRPLRDIAKVFFSIARYQYQDYITKDSLDPEVTANILRVSDMREFGLREPELFLTRAGETRLEGKLKPEHWLCPGDIVLSTSGTIGKVTFFTDSVGFRKTLAADGLAVIRPKGQIIIPEFLFTLLRSPIYQEWVRGHAQGSSIQHLSVQILRDLPVPVPAIAIQHRLWKQTEGEITDVLATLLQGVTGVNDDPILKWLERSKAAYALAHIEVEAKYRLQYLNQFNNELLDLRNRWAHNIQPMRISPEITPWLLRMTDAAHALRDVQEIPSGTGRIAVFKTAQLVVQEAITTLSNVSILANPIRKVSSNISRLISQEVKSLLENTQIDIHPDPASVVVGTPNEVVLKIKNSAVVALRNIHVGTTPNIGAGETSYLMEDAEFAVPVIVESQQTSGTYDFLVTWIARRLDGTSVHGATSLSLAIRSLRESSVTNLGASPYIVGKPIEREEMFYGRDDVIEQIKDHLNDETQSNVILLEGNRRTGKTSILKQLQKHNNLPSWLTVECSLQGADSMATHHVFRLFARRIWDACTVAEISTWLPSQPPPAPNKPLKLELVKALSATFSEAYPFEAFELYLQSVLEAIQPCKLLLMLDEFDKLQEGIDQGITNPQVPENIRYLLHTYSDMSAIITGSRRLKRLREEYWSALFGFGYQISISALPLDDARKLVTEPVEGRLLFLPEARDRIVNLCACQPFLIQSLCTRIFEQSKRQTERTVTPTLVESAVTAMVEDNEHFRTLWNYAGTERRRMILTICQRFGSSDDLTNLDFLETKFEEFGIRVPRKRGLGEDLDFLRELELINFDSTQGREAYALSIPLMEKWIQRHIDFEDLKREAMREAEEVL